MIAVEIFIPEDMPMRERECIGEKKYTKATKTTSTDSENIEWMDGFIKGGRK